MRVLVTGTSGFVGSALASQLAAAGAHEVVAPVRRPLALPGVTTVPIGGIGPDTDWRSALAGVEAVIHCAGRAHLMADPAPDPLAEFRRVNTAGTLKLAEAAAEAGTRRLVFVSSAKVHGATGLPDRPFRETDPPAPADPYAVSKWEAEQDLHRLAGRSGLELVVVRPPLVYGPEPKANMLRLLRLVDRGLPLPFGAVRNRRSMIGLDNLVSALVATLERPAAAGRTYLVADHEVVATPQLVRLLARTMQKPVRLLPVPPPLLMAAGRLAGRGEDLERLLGSYEVDASCIGSELGWRPPVSLAAGIARMVGSYRRQG